MGSIYDRNKNTPERGPNIYIRFREPGGRWRSRPVGHVNPEGLTRSQLRAKERELRRLAREVLARVEGDIVAGQYELARAAQEAPQQPLFRQAMEDWARRRDETHRDGSNDLSRARVHLIPFFKAMRLDEITTAEVKRYVVYKQDTTALAGPTIWLTLMLLSRFFNDQIEAGAALRNPVVGLDRATRRRLKSRHDPRMTPFLRRKADIRAVYLALPAPYNVMFAVGVFGGLRTGEIVALDWGRDVDLSARRIHVQHQVKRGRLGLLKDRESRVVPVLDSLLPVLREHRMRTGGRGLLFAPHPRRGGRPGSPPRFRRARRLNERLKKVLVACELEPTLTWYQCTRHTFASHWVMDGRPLALLRDILGHSTVKVTERYAHLRRDAFTTEDYAAVKVDLSASKVLRLEAREGTAG